MTNILNEPKAFLFQIYYEEKDDGFGSKKYILKNVIIDKKLNIKKTYMNTFEKSMNLFVDIIKEYVLKKVQNIKKVIYDIGFFNEKLPIHTLILEAIQFVFPSCKLDEICKSIVVMIKDENKKILHLGLFNIKNVSQNTLEDYFYVKNERKKGNSIILCNTCEKYCICQKCHKCHRCYECAEYDTKYMYKYYYL